MAWSKLVATAGLLVACLGSNIAKAADDNVRLSQQFLLALGYKIGVADGVSGKRTEAAIVDALAKYGQSYDGTLSDNEVALLARVAPVKIESEFGAIVSEIYLVDAADVNGDSRLDFLVSAMADPSAQLGIPCCEVPAALLPKIVAPVPVLIYSTPQGFVSQPFPDDGKGLRTWAGRFFTTAQGSFVVLGRNGEMGLPTENHGEPSIIFKIDAGADGLVLTKAAEFPTAGVTASVEVIDLDEDGNPEIFVNNYNDLSATPEWWNSVLMEFEPDGSLVSVGSQLGMEPRKAYNYIRLMDVNGTGKPDLFAAGEIQKSFDGKSIDSERPGSFVMLDPWDGKAKRIYLDPPHFANNHSGISVMPISVDGRTFVFEAAIEFFGHQAGGFGEYNLDVFELSAEDQTARLVTDKVLPKAFEERPSSNFAYLRRADLDFDGTDEIYAQQYVEKPQFLDWNGTAFALVDFPTKDFFKPGWSARLLLLPDDALKCVRAVTVTNSLGDEGKTAANLQISACVPMQTKS